MAERLPARREVACGPSLHIDQESRIGYIWIDDSSVKAELVVRSSAVRSAVVFAPGSNGAPAVGVGHGPVLNHSDTVEVNSVEVCPPSVDHMSRHVSAGPAISWEYLRECFDDTLVQSYADPFSGHPPGNDRPRLPPHTPLYNKYVGCGSLMFLSKCNKGNEFYGPFRNIKIGKPAIGGGLHIGEMVRFQTRTFVYNLGDRVTNTLLSAVRVPNGHHEGNNYFAPGCISDLPLPSHCRIVCIDARKLRWCSVDSVAFHSFVWPTTGREAKSLARTLYANHCDWVDVLIVRGRCFRSNKLGLRANRVLENFPQTKGGTTGVGFLFAIYRITFVNQVLPSSAYLPRLA